ncbi:yiaA/B two helix domain protein [Pelagimonas phthalicica]|uniref:YiaA/B two helix domain protein n=1 Tax=Pelagimonas phthalicica TaxID=1037362 RepID=A0A238JCV1_9RHOB|nr:hypothetical protein [Pelagimonas phthalicica]TDS90987.1 hypothetical protein CLV87_2148 [Pelagimonas phthalicica]SMX28034.1 yiaA/B two helix domain protein [Pelagimonas phthalicica]
MNNASNENGMILLINMAGVALAYALLAISLWLSVDVPLSTKGYWGMGIVLLTISLINVVKYKFDQRISNDRINRIEEAKNEKILEDALREDL